MGEYGALAYRGRLPADPSITLHMPGAGRLLAMIHAPARGDAGQPDGAALAAAEANVLTRLGRLGITPGTTRRIGPAEFEAMFPGTGGALYGQAVQGWQATFSRPSSRTKLAGLYLAGGGTHPGAGVAMAALSGRLAAAEILG
jgi:1-hydroxycarotenoid 3,4-desaturase